MRKKRMLNLVAFDGFHASNLEGNNLVVSKAYFCQKVACMIGLDSRNIVFIRYIFVL